MNEIIPIDVKPSARQLVLSGLCALAAVAALVAYALDDDDWPPMSAAPRPPPVAGSAVSRAGTAPEEPVVATTTLNDHTAQDGFAARNAAAIHLHHNLASPKEPPHVVNR